LRIGRIIGECSKVEAEFAARAIELKALRTVESARIDSLQKTLCESYDRLNVSISEHAAAVGRVESAEKIREASIVARMQEHRRRVILQKEAEQAESVARQRVPELKCPASLAHQRREWSLALDDYRKVEQRYEGELGKIRAKARDGQLREFLETFAIDKVRHPGIHDSLIVTLKANGIETAADIHPVAILAVRGFGEKRTETLVRWRAKCESGFRFDPKRPLSQKELSLIRLRFSGDFGRAEGRLRLVAEQLKAAHCRAVEAVDRASKELSVLVQAAAQAKADASELP
jgi:DNA-binding helix-hairpin-helix protein with protein kinase domain